MGKPLDYLTGLRFSRITVGDRADNYRGKARWHCLCDCGTKSIAVGSSLKSGNTTSCGCRQRTVNLKHGRSTKGREGHYLYTAYRNAFNRCNLPSDKEYKNYGARGIRMGFANFEEFAEACGERPGPEFTLDRIDCEKDYELGNLRWSDKSVQSVNRRHSGKNTSGLRGVCKTNPKSDRWQANVTFRGVVHSLGSSFLTPEAAARAYDAKARSLHGENAHLNFPN